MANPDNLQYCKIVGNFKAFVADGVDDDDLPDFVPMTGSGSIWPNVTITKNTSPGFKSTYFNSPISVEIDQDGDLSQGGRKYVMVLADSSQLNPNDFNYSILLNLSAQGEPTYRQYGPFSFDIIPGGQVDLTDVLPVDVNKGTPIIQGPTGNPGDMVQSLSLGNWSGSVTLPQFPVTYLSTLSGSVTSLSLPTPPTGFSGTITLVLTQDATGGRTITWPSAVKWPEGIQPQPTAGAGSMSMFNLLWTGADWLGMVGGKTFA